MKISFVESGGLLGIERRCDVDTAAGDPQEARELERLVREAGAGQARGKTSRAARDARVYEIEVEDGGRSTRLVFDDVTLPAQAKPLVGFLRRRAKPARP